MSEFRNYDADGVFDGLVLSVHGFDESDPGKLHVCKNVIGPSCQIRLRWLR